MFTVPCPNLFIPGFIYLFIYLFSFISVRRLRRGCVFGKNFSAKAKKSKINEYK